MCLYVHVSHGLWEGSMRCRHEGLRSEESWGQALSNCSAYADSSVNIYVCLCVCACARTHVKLLQLCPTLCNTMDCSPPGSSVHDILQARILEWVAIPFSRGSSPPRYWTWVSCTAAKFLTLWAARKAWFSLTELCYFYSMTDGGNTGICRAPLPISFSASPRVWHFCALIVCVIWTWFL